MEQTETERWRHYWATHLVPGDKTIHASISKANSTRWGMKVLLFAAMEHPEWALWWYRELRAESENPDDTSASALSVVKNLRAGGEQE